MRENGLRKKKIKNREIYIVEISALLVVIGLDLLGQLLDYPKY
jgi:hypothetical protein